MLRSALSRRRFVLALAPFAAAALSAQDPCLLTMTEARELGGSEISQAGGDAVTCRYVTASGASRVAVELLELDSESGRALVEELGDATRFTTRQKGRITVWTSRADELAGWVRRGERLAAVRAEGEASVKRRRALEHALFRVADKLR